MKYNKKKGKVLLKKLVNTPNSIRQIISSFFKRSLKRFNPPPYPPFLRDHHHRQFTKICPLALVMLDRELRIIFATDKWVSMCRLQNQDLYGKNYFELLPHLPERWRDTFNDCLKGEHQRREEEAFLRPTGITEWFRWEVRPWHLENGQIGGLMLFFENITERKIIESELQSSVESFRQLATAMPQKIWASDPHGSFNYGNEQWHHLVGPNCKNLLQNGWEKIIHPDDLILWQQSWLLALDQNKEVSLECRFYIREEKSYRWFLCRGVPFTNSAGILERWFGSCTDIHDLKSSHEQLGRTLRELADIKFALDQSSILVITNAKGVIAYVNDKFCEVSQYSREELIGKTHKLINSSFHPSLFFQELWQTISAGNIWRGEIQNRAKDGSLYWVDTVIVPFLDENKRPYQYMAIRNDITERKNNEHERAHLLAREHLALESSRLKSEFIANVGHEIRTPLNGIMAFSEVLLRSNLNTEQEEQAQLVHKSAQVLLGLINDILDLSKIESGKMDLEKISFDPVDLIKESAHELQGLAQSKGIFLELELCSADLGLLVGDPKRLRQIIINLLANAVKFTSRGGVKLKLSIKSEDSTMLELKIAVEDSGIGIHKKNLSKLFTPFTQSDSSTTRNYGGSGLGLSICKRLTELMGGEIGVNSTFGKGSLFWVIIKFEKDQLRHLDSTSHSNLALPKFSAETKILLVEDMPINQKAASLLLAQFGLKADYAQNGIEAIQAVKKKAYDLIFMDCRMPIMDGPEATAIIRSTPELNRSHPIIIAVTASVMNGDKERCLAVGMDDYLPKPLGLVNLQQCLQKWLSTPSPQTVPSLAVPELGSEELSVDWQKVGSLLELDSIQGLSSELFQEMLELFETNAPVKLEKIKDAMSTKNVEGLLASSHELKSSTCYLGAIGISRLCDQIRLEAQAHQFDKGAELIQRLEEEYRKTLSQLQIIRSSKAVMV